MTTVADATHLIHRIASFLMLMHSPDWLLQALECSTAQPVRGWIKLDLITALSFARIRIRTRARSLGGPALEPQGSASRALDPGPSALTLPLVGGGGALTDVTGDTAHLIVFVEVEVAYTPCPMALGAA